MCNLVSLYMMDNEEDPGEVTGEGLRGPWVGLGRDTPEMGVGVRQVGAQRE